MRALLLLAGFMVGYVAFGQKVDDLIRFEKSEHSFGKVAKEQPVTVEFTFTNPGTKPLVIDDCTAECGCTVPEFPKRPIMPGKNGVIKVTYDAKEPGVFTKKITVKLVNVAEPKILTIRGEVAR
ncbi:MAG TPA: DUF1573 domain-containing protein [Phnomibacter sp.]|nr:DUF1573 domain-containing protein [Phnomibacter sp.]